MLSLLLGYCRSQDILMERSREHMCKHMHTHRHTSIFVSTSIYKQLESRAIRSILIFSLPIIVTLFVFRLTIVTLFSWMEYNKSYELLLSRLGYKKTLASSCMPSLILLLLILREVMLWPSLYTVPHGKELTSPANNQWGTEACQQHVSEILLTWTFRWDCSSGQHLHCNFG